MQKLKYGSQLVKMIGISYCYHTIFKKIYFSTFTSNKYMFFILGTFQSMSVLFKGVLGYLTNAHHTIQKASSTKPSTISAWQSQ